MNRMRGMTLVEVLVACALVGLVAGTAVAVLSGGLAVWERGQTQGAREEWVGLAFHQLRQDLRNARRFELIPFEGRYDAFSFASPVEVEDHAGTSWHELGRTGYFLDPRSRSLCRSQQPYRVLRRHRMRDACTEVLSEVDRLRVAYYRVHSETEVAEWVESWSSPELPLAVRVQVGSRDPRTQRLEYRSLLVYLPVATWPEDRGSGGS